MSLNSDDNTTNTPPGDNPYTAYPNEKALIDKAAVPITMGRPGVLIEDTTQQSTGVEPPQVDYDSALGEALDSTYDAEDDIYGKRPTSTALFSNKPINLIDAANQQQAGDAQATIDTWQPGMGKDLAQGALNFAEGYNNPQNPISGAGEFDIAKSALGGSIEGGLSVLDLFDYWTTEASIAAAQKLTGKSREELQNENPFLFKAANREIPDWLKPDTLAGQTAAGIAQFMPIYAGLDKLTKLGRVQKLLGVGGAAAPWLANMASTIEAGSENVPTLKAAVQVAKNLVETSPKVVATDYLGFDAHQGNLANAIQDVASSNIWVAKDVASWLNQYTKGYAVTPNDNEAEGRLKNTLMSAYGEAGGAVLFGLTSLLGKTNRVHSLVQEAQSGSNVTQDLKEILTGAESDLSLLEPHIESINNTSLDDIIDEIFKEANPEVYRQPTTPNIQPLVGMDVTGAHASSPHEGPLHLSAGDVTDTEHLTPGNETNAHSEAPISPEKASENVTPIDIKQQRYEEYMRKWWPLWNEWNDANNRIWDAHEAGQPVNIKDQADYKRLEQEIDQLNKEYGQGKYHPEGEDLGSEDDVITLIHPEPKLEIIHPTDTVEQAADKLTQAHQSVQGERMGTNEAAIKSLVEQLGKQGTKAFSAKEFAQSLVEKIKAGEPIDIHQEILNNTKSIDLTNVESYVENFKNIVEATTTSVKRTESNQDLVTRVKSILGLDLGHEAWSAGMDTEAAGKLNGLAHNAFQSLTERGYKSLTQDEEALMEMMGLKMLKDHLIPMQLLQLGAARSGALEAGDKSLLTSLDHQIRKHYSAMRQSEELFRQYLSNAGRRLQAGGQAETTMGDAADFLKTFSEYKKGLPLLAHGSDEMTDAELDALTWAAKDFTDMGGHDNPGNLGKISKHVGKFLNAVTTVGARTGRYALGAAQEVFYNNVLASLDTLKNIGFSNAALKTHDLLSSGTGALLMGDKESMLRVKDEAEAFIRYMSEGMGAGLTVLRTGQKDKLDFTPKNPKVISSEGLRQTFGKSVGEAFQQEIFGQKPGQFADRVIDAIGTVVNIPTTHFIGAIDTAFRVANTRAIIYTELKQLGRFRGLDDLNARSFSLTHLDKVTEDLIVGRELGFKGDDWVANQVLNSEQLRNINEKIIGSTDQMNLQHPLKSARNPYLDPSAPYKATPSDRWVFKFFGKIQDASQMLGLAGTWEMPFIKTFANGVQYGADGIPFFNMLSPYNQKILMGEMGIAAQQNLLGKTFLGALLGLGGIGAANAGLLANTLGFHNVDRDFSLLAPNSGSMGAKKIDQQLTGENSYTIHFPNGDKNAVTLNFSKGSPLADAFFLPGRIWQLSHDAYDGQMDPGAYTFAMLSSMGEAFSSGRFLRGMSVSLDSWLNPTYSTADNFQRNLTGSLFYNVAPLGGRLWSNVTRFTDPYYRDWNYTGNPIVDTWNYAKSQIPGLSNQESPLYDMFGSPRPRDDYLDTTTISAENLTRALTPIGIRYTPNDQLSKEIERFGKLGQSLTPLNKNLSISGTQIPLDQFRNDKGESLWDMANKEMANYTVPSATGSGKQLKLRDYLNEFVTSDEYKNDMKDNEVTKITGKRQVVLGSRWAELAGTYQEAKDNVRDALTSNEDYLTKFKNAKGETLEKVLDDMSQLKEQQGL